MNQPAPLSDICVNLVDGAYSLSEGAAWIDVGKFTIRIHTTDEGLVTDIYSAALAKTGDFDAALIASSWVHNNEADELDEPGPGCDEPTVLEPKERL